MISQWQAVINNIRPGDLILVYIPTFLEGVFEVDRITRFGPCLKHVGLVPKWAEIYPPF